MLGPPSLQPLSIGKELKGDDDNQQGTADLKTMTLTEHADVVDPDRLPARGKYLRYYLLGMADGEGCFTISIKKQASARFGWVLDPIFHVTQHRDHRAVLELFRRELRCGKIIVKHGQPETLQYVVQNRREIREKVLPFFHRYKPIVKTEEFRKFAEIVEALEAGQHHDLNRFKVLLATAYTMNYEGKQRRRPLFELVDDLEAQTPQRLQARRPSSEEG